MRKYKLSRIARRDLRDIWRYIARDSPAIATRFVDSLVDRFPALAETPNLGPSRPNLGENIRIHPVDRYVIIYRPTSEGVDILRITRGDRRLEDLMKED